MLQRMYGTLSLAGCQSALLLCKQAVGPICEGIRPAHAVQTKVFKDILRPLCALTYMKRVACFLLLLQWSLQAILHHMRIKHTPLHCNLA